MDIQVLDYVIASNKNLDEIKTIIQEKLKIAQTKSNNSEIKFIADVYDSFNNKFYKVFPENIKTVFGLKSAILDVTEQQNSIRPGEAGLKTKVTPLLENIDLNISETGFYHTKPTTTGTFPENIIKDGILLIEKYSETVSKQTYSPISNDGVFTRIYSDNTGWQEWVLNANSKELSKYALKTELPDLTNIDSKIDSKVNEKLEPINNKIDLKLDKTGIAADSAKLNNKAASEYALKTELPDVANLLTKQKAEETYLKISEKPDISNLALKSEIPDTSNFLTVVQGDDRYALKGSGGGSGSGNIDTSDLIHRGEYNQAIQTINQELAKKPGLDDANKSWVTTYSSEKIEQAYAGMYAKIEGEINKASDTEPTANKLVRRDDSGKVKVAGLHSSEMIEAKSLKTDHIVGSVIPELPGSSPVWSASNASNRPDIIISDRSVGSRQLKRVTFDKLSSEILKKVDISGLNLSSLDHKYTKLGSYLPDGDLSSVVYWTKIFEGFHVKNPNGNYTNSPTTANLGWCLVIANQRVSGYSKFMLWIDESLNQIKIGRCVSGVGNNVLWKDFNNLQSSLLPDGDTKTSNYWANIKPGFYFTGSGNAGVLNKPTQSAVFHVTTWGNNSADKVIHCYPATPDRKIYKIFFTGSGQTRDWVRIGNDTEELNRWGDDRYLFKYNNITTEDIDTFKTSGFYSQAINANAILERHYPVANKAGSLVVKQTSANTANQEYTVYDTQEIYVRGMYNGNWQPWVLVTNHTLDIGDRDLNIITQPGNYRQHLANKVKLNQNYPVADKVGVLEVITYSSNGIVQRYTLLENGDTYVRSINGSSILPWKLVSVNDEIYYNKNKANGSKIYGHTNTVANVGEADNVILNMHGAGVFGITNAKVGQSGTIIINNATNITGYGSYIKWQNVPTGLKQKEIFAYFVEDLNNIWMGRLV